MAPSPHPVTKSTTAAPRARCAQCGKVIRHLPFTLGNLSCRDCYGGDRYPRGIVPPSPVEAPPGEPIPENP
jgi:hypothetical protein